MGQVLIPDDVNVQGSLTALRLNAPAGCIADAQVAVAAGVQSTKLIHRNTYTYELFGVAVSVAALTKVLQQLRGATGTLVSVAITVTGAVATGADRTVTVDVKKSTAGGAFATVLASTMGLTNGSTLLTAVVGTFASTGLVAGDVLEAVVTVAGSASAQALGLILTLVVDEAPISLASAGPVGGIRLKPGL